MDVVLQHLGGVGALVQSLLQFSDTLSEAALALQGTDGRGGRGSEGDRTRAGDRRTGGGGQRGTGHGVVDSRGG